MQKQKTKNNRARSIGAKFTTWLLLIALLMQSLSMTIFAAKGTGTLFRDSVSESIQNNIGNFDSDETIAQLKKDFLKSVNQDLLHKIEDYELTGSVGVILTFSDNSLISSYPGVASGITYEEYRNSSSASKLQAKLRDNQANVLSQLTERGLISEVKYNYFHILDGAFVMTTYEQIDEICKIEGVERVTISNTYQSLSVVENPVNVYDTGIFNSSNISYTGKGTIVAVLDTGCDYTHSAFTTYQVVSPLYDRDDIAEMLPGTMAYGYDNSLEVREVYYGNITGNKIAFGYDYADKDPDIMPFSESHGTHVAGVIAGKDDKITGVAVDAQLAIMKVFSDYKAGAEDGDIMAALEDAVILNVDAINMSLGTSSGFTREVDEEFKNDIYGKIEDAGISLIAAASNDYSSGFGGEESNTNKTDNPDSATVGAPSTYNAAMSVASIDGRKEKYMLVNGEREIFFNEAYNASSKEYNFFEMLGITKDNPVLDFEYVTIPGYGYAINYAGLDMAGKIALVRRGDITFEEKVQFAREAGAAGIIIYNNVFGEISMTVGNDLQIPVISIGKDDGDAMAASATGNIRFDYSNVAGPFMSDFSSWGPTPDLTLKPEITAHGGYILSAVVGGEYEEMSGTSMAAPNMCGITVLIRQYVKESFSELSVTEIRDMVNQLTMSTATIALDHKGNPYSPRKQGAGIADIVKATSTPAYLFVEGKNKTKLELGDDPDRTGVYTMTISLKNISNNSVSYRLGNIAMTESISTSEPEYVAEMAYLLSNSANYEIVKGDGTLADGVLTVNAGNTVSVKVTLTLSREDKSYLNSTFANGMFVEGFLTFDNVEENGVDLNAPFLAFYGDWGEAPIFDLDYYEVETEAHNNAIDDDDKIKADYYPTTPMGTYYYDYVLPLGSYVYDMDESQYTPIPAIREHAAVSYYEDAISGIYGVFAGLLRGAKEMTVSIVDTSTGKEVWSKTDYNCYKAHFSGAVTPYVEYFNLPMVNYDTNEVFGGNNAHYEVTMTAKLDWESDERNSSDTYSFSFYIDYEAPTVVDATFRTEYDKSREENRYYADIIVSDNHYAMAIRPIIVYDYEENGETRKTYSSLTQHPIPIYQENLGESTKVTIEITDYLDMVATSENPEGLTVYIEDYAMNGNIAYIPFPETESDDLEFVDEELDLDINSTLDLTTKLVHKDTTTVAEPGYLKMLTWTSSDPSVVAINNGKIEALKSGTAEISVKGSSWDKAQTLTINVSDTVDEDNPESSKNILIESLEFTSYDTLFAFTGDIDFSGIGLTGSHNYFGGNYSLSFYPSEKIKLNYSLEPWNISEDRYTLEWKSSNPKVATVDENGVVTAEEEGIARISLNITIDGKTSLLAARCAITVKSEFIIENRTLVAYKGKGGEVVIPDDEGITTIGAFAFCHYNLDNEKDVEKDENGSYDLDLKKEPLGNNTVTSVVIPEGVETIEKYAFYNCKILSDVTLPTTCKTVKEYAFAQCEVLENVNFDNVKIVLDYGFYKCESLNCKDLGGANLSGIYAIGKYAFSDTRFEEVDLTKLSRVSIGAFADCKKLKTVELGEKTRIAENMFQNTPIEQIVIYGDSISDAAFKGCSQLTLVDIRNDITYLGAEAFSDCVKLEEVVFSGACEKIAELAFFNCTSLETFELPNCELVIGDGAFASSGISELVFGANTFITEAGVSMFDSVKSFTADVSASNNYKLSDGVIYSADGSRLVLVLPDTNIKSFTVPAAVKEICDGAFSSNINIKNVDFASKSELERIGIAAFANCTALESVTLPNNEIVIGGYAFMGTTALTTVNLEGVKSVAEFAFEGSAISSANLSHEGVVIGEGAFYGCTNLRTVILGKGASIGSYSFANSYVMTVDLVGSGVVVGEGAFAACSMLKSFDFEHVTGKLSDYAFYGCASLKKVYAPNITEIGEACFADCYGLTEFSAENLEIVGAYAFAPYSEESTQGASFTTIYAPKLTTIGEGAFNACYQLVSIDLSNVTKIDFGAFYMCYSLETVTLSENLEELPDYAFFGCTALSNLELSNIVRFGVYSLYGVKLPAKLELTKAEYLAYAAFAEFFNEDSPVVNYIEYVNAPNLKHIDDQAFYYCAKLEKIDAPKLEEIGVGAFAYTAISEFEIFDTLKVVDYSLFNGNENFKAFFTTVDGKKVYTYEYDDVMINDGVLYTVTPKGYVLSCYPAAKEGSEFTVADGTVKIDFGAALGNKYLEKVILPESLRFIGNNAFYQCDNLKTVVFKSYYAPVLEGTLTGDAIEITPDTVEKYPGFEKLYKYDFYYKMQDVVATPMYYGTFVDVILTEKASEISYVIPKNSFGYDSKLYKAYFLASENEDSGTVTGPYAWAFIDAVNNLPEVADRFDEALINAAINAYNALDGKESEMALVDSSYVASFNKALSEYKVSVMENKINHLFDMDNSKYSFDLVKDAREYYLALAEEERGLLGNGDVLNEKIEELSAAMGMTPDFSKTYEDHFRNDLSDDPVDPGDDDGNVLKTVLIVCASVIGTAIIAAVVIILLKKKSAANK